MLNVAHRRIPLKNNINNAFKYKLNTNFVHKTEMALNSAK